jgi:hypothetical protein
VCACVCVCVCVCVWACVRVPKVAERSGGRCDAGSAEAHRQCNFSALVPNLPLIIACAVGILCTYAEPAIASLRPLAEIFKRCDTPYLFFVFNDIVCVCVCACRACSSKTPTPSPLLF